MELCKCMYVCRYIMCTTVRYTQYLNIHQTGSQQYDFSTATAGLSTVISLSLLQLQIQPLRRLSLSLSLYNQFLTYTIKFSISSFHFFTSFCTSSFQHSTQCIIYLLCRYLLFRSLCPLIFLTPFSRSILFTSSSLLQIFVFLLYS